MPVAGRAPDPRQRDDQAGARGGLFGPAHDLGLERDGIVAVERRGRARDRARAARARARRAARRARSRPGSAAIHAQSRASGEDQDRGDRSGRRAQDAERRASASASRIAEREGHAPQNEPHGSCSELGAGSSCLRPESTSASRGGRSYCALRWVKWGSLVEARERLRDADRSGLQRRHLAGAEAGLVAAERVRGEVRATGTGG